MKQRVYSLVLAVVCIVLIPVTGAMAGAPDSRSMAISDTVTPQVVAVPEVRAVPGIPNATTASFTVRFSSALPGQGEVYFGPGPGCSDLVEVATQDLHPETTQHEV